MIAVSARCWAFDSCFYNNKAGLLQFVVGIPPRMITALPLQRIRPSGCSTSNTQMPAYTMSVPQTLCWNIELVWKIVGTDPCFQPYETQWTFSFQKQGFHIKPWSKTDCSSKGLSYLIRMSHFPWLLLALIRNLGENLSFVEPKSS